jgi:Neuraminidase (sialidase)
MNKILIILSLVLSSHAQATPSSYEVIDSAPAAAMFAHLNGPAVITEGTVKSLVLDQKLDTVLSCDSSKSVCSIKNTEFVPTKNSDYDSLLVLTGASAELLKLNFTGLNSSGGIELGDLGKDGTAYLQCTKNTATHQCEISVSYCDQPGC